MVGNCNPDLFYWAGIKAVAGHFFNKVDMLPGSLFTGPMEVPEYVSESGSAKAG